MSLSKLSLARLITFGVAIVFGLIIMAISAHTISLSEKWLGGYRDSGAFGVAIGVITMAVLIPLVVIDFLRSGAFTSKILVEGPVVFVLWVLWLACAALFADDNRLLPSDCNYYGGRAAVDAAETGCREYHALTGLAFLVWIILTAYLVTLLVFTILGGQKAGHGTAWNASVRELTSDEFTSHNEKPNHMTTMQQQPTTQQPQVMPQHPQQPQQVYQQPAQLPAGNPQYSSYPQV